MTGLGIGALIALGLCVFAILQPAVSAGALLVLKKYRMGTGLLVWAAIMLISVVMAAYLLGFYLGMDYLGPLEYV